MPSGCMSPQGSAAHFLKCSYNGQTNMYVSLLTDYTKKEMARFELM